MDKVKGVNRRIADWIQSANRPTTGAWVMDEKGRALSHRGMYPDEMWMPEDGDTPVALIWVEVIGTDEVRDEYTRYGQVLTVIEHWSEPYGDKRTIHIDWIVRPEYEGHDLCGYCGADNGVNGEYRHGFDCCACGSN